MLAVDDNVDDDKSRECMLAFDDEVDEGESSEWTIKESADHEKSLHDHEKSLRTTKRVCGP